MKARLFTQEPDFTQKSAPFDSFGMIWFAHVQPNSGFRYESGAARDPTAAVTRVAAGGNGRCGRRCHDLLLSVGYSLGRSGPRPVAAWDGAHQSGHHARRCGSRPVAFGTQRVRGRNGRLYGQRVGYDFCKYVDLAVQLDPLGGSQFSRRLDRPVVDRVARRSCRARSCMVAERCPVNWQSTLQVRADCDCCSRWTKMRSKKEGK